MPPSEQLDLTGAVQTSVDGQDWLRVADDASLWDGSRLESVIAGGPGIIAVGSMSIGGATAGPNLWTSPDGLVWTKMPPAPETFGPDAVMAGIAALGERLVLVGYVEADDRQTATVWSTDAIE